MSEYAMRTLLASPALDFMYISASAPEAPPLSETTIGCFIRLFFWMAACIILAIWSEAPPAPAATTISTGLVGSQANAGAVASARLASAPAKKSSFLLMSLLLFLGLRNCLGSLPCRRLGAARKVIHRRLYAFLLDWNACELQAHLASCECTHERQIIEIAQVADAEYLAGELA